ncbi:MAG: hypothetical protein PHW77_04295 [Eubacteriales bacterium]|nr:hypothetical protein [Eubacteriales bacterium]
MSIVLKVIYIVVCIGVGFLVAGLIFLSVNGSANEIHIGDSINISLPFTYEEIGYGGFPQLIAGCILNIIAGVLGLIIIKNAYMIFKEISVTARPFEKIYVKRLKTIALIMIISNFGLSFIRGITESIMGGKIGNWFQTYDIFTAVLIYCLALIFDYGCDLQKQSDETI